MVSLGYNELIVNETKTFVINPCPVELILGNIKIPLHFLSILSINMTCVIQIPSSGKSNSHLSCIVNMVAADDQAVKGIRASATMVLTQFCNIPFSSPEGLKII